MDTQLLQDWEKHHKVRTITAKEWDMQRNNFTRLYILEDRHLTDVRKIMAERYGFFANPKQCKTAIKRWGIGKSFTKTKVTAILGIQRKRALQGKDTDFKLNGQLVDMKRLDRAHKRHCDIGDVAQRGELCSSLDIATPLGIEYSTPKTPSSPIHYSPQIEGGHTPDQNTTLKTNTKQGLNFPEGEKTQDMILPLTPETNEHLSSFIPSFNTRDPNIENMNSMPFTTRQTPDASYLIGPNTTTTTAAAAGDIPQEVPNQVLPQDLMEWDSIFWGNSFSETGSSGEKESYLVPGHNAVDYSKSSQPLRRAANGRLIRDIESFGDEIKRVKEASAKMSEYLAALAEERRLLTEMCGNDKVALTSILLSLRVCLWLAQKIIIINRGL